MSRADRRWEHEGRADRRAGVLDEAAGVVEDTIDNVKDSWRRD